MTDWQRSQAALLAMGERMGQFHEKNPAATATDASVAVDHAIHDLRIPGGTYAKDTLLSLAAAALYAWVVLDEQAPAAPASAGGGA